MPAARFSTNSVIVACGSCNAPQANPADGSLQWDINQLQQVAGSTMICSDCNKPILMRAPKSVAVA